MDNYVNWFVNDGQTNFQKYLPTLAASKSIRCLQIGAYTGDASLWLYNNILKYSDSILVDVDTWEGSEEPVHYEMNWHTVESLYDIKTAEGKADRKIIKYKGTSDNFFKNNREMYDFIYIDGDHTAYGVLKDAVAAYECLNVGGIIAFDDYQWSAGLGDIKEPKMAIDAFNAVYGDKIEEMFQGYQRWFKKVR
jgi:predicted O-methyltransferase YrrM